MRLHLLDLLDAVLQDDDDGVLITQPGQPASPVGVLGGFDRQQHHPTGSVISAGSVHTGPGHHDRIALIGPQFDL